MCKRYKNYDIESYHCTLQPNLNNFKSSGLFNDLIIMDFKNIYHLSYNITWDDRTYKYNDYKDTL